MEKRQSLGERVAGWHWKLVCFFISLSASIGIGAFGGGMTAFAQDHPYRTVKVGYYQARNFQEGDGKTSLRSGYSYEYLQKVAAYTGWKYEYVPGDWEELYKKLVDGKIDVFAGVSYSDERAEQICYPDYEMLKETFYIYKDVSDSSMRSGDIASYSGKRIGVVNDEKILASVENWMEETQAKVELVQYKDLAECASDFNRHKLDGFVSADNIVSGYTGITPVELLGREPYYLGVSKKDPELLEELNQALSIISGQDSLYLDALRKKYTADTSISVFLSQQEQEWMKNHPKITVGYLNNYMPYSDTKKDGSVTGLVADLVPDLFAALPGDYHPEIIYEKFDSHDQMIEALKDRSVDFVFPVGGEMQYAEQLGYQQSSVVLSSSTDLVYKGAYSRQTTKKMAVNRDNQLQYFYTLANYPKAEVIYGDTIEDCMKMVRSGKADSTIINALRSVKLVGTDGTLNILPLEKTDDRCFGVDFGNSDLLRLLNHGITILGEGYGINHAYQYIGDLVSYTADDFFRAHAGVLYGTVSVLLILLTILSVRRYKNLHKRALREREQNQVLEDALYRAQQASYAKQIFLNNMSHDIRTPLNAILGIIEINRKSKDEQLIEENRKKATAAIYQLLSLVNNVIEMSKLEGEASAGEQERVDLKQVTRDLEQSIERQASEAGITFIRESGELPECEVYGNTAHIREVLQHVLENAVKYNKPDGQIVWREELRPDPAEPEKMVNHETRVIYDCTVSDTGIGMEPGFLGRIFEPFSQERIDARTVYRGAGLGMPIAKTLIDQMNGTIEVESERNVGTTVHISIPFTKALKEKAPETVESPVTLTQSGSSEDKNKEEELQNLSGMRILLVEDNELNIEIARFLLEDAGAQVFVAMDGSQAVTFYLNEGVGTFDAVLMDIMMPVMDGYEATRKIRSSGREDAATIPIFATTACVSEEARMECVNAGMNEFLEKPLDMSKVIAAIVRFTEKNQVA